MYFDSCAHPTIDGGWLGSSRGVTFAQFKEELASSDLVGSVAIGLPGIGGYDPIKYFELAVSYDLFPVAPLTSYEDPSIASEIDELSKIGYTAIKIHPRLMGKNNDWSFLKAALRFFCSRTNPGVCRSMWTSCALNRRRSWRRCWTK